MGFLALKTLISAILIAAISKIAKRSPAFAALIASLPLISVLGMLWLYHETSDVQRIASHAEATFWLVLPSLPMFLLLPALLRQGVGFYTALALNCALTALLYFGMARLGAAFGLKF